MATFLRQHGLIGETPSLEAVSFSDIAMCRIHAGPQEARLKIGNEERGVMPMRLSRRSP